MDNMQTTLAINAVIVWLLEALKKSKWFPWLSAESQKVNRLASAALSALAAAGIVIQAHHTGAGAWAIAISGLTLANSAHFVFHAVLNYATQKGLFKIYSLNGNGTAGGKQ